MESEGTSPYTEEPTTCPYRSQINPVCAPPPTQPLKDPF
jgi:hypothetical protein